MPPRRPAARLITVPLLALVLGACGATAGAGPGNATGAMVATAPSSPSASPSPSPAEGPVARAWARWQQHRTGNYRYRLTLGCFCPRWTYEVEVRNGKVARVRLLDENGRPVHQPALENEARTVDDLFAELLRAEGDPLPARSQPRDTPFAGPAAKVRATFDPNLGYPLSVYIDWSVQVADEETGYLVSHFEAL